jgi:predicted transcriptional regulator
MNLKVSKEFKRRLKVLAAQEGRLMVEVLEKALAVYERQKTNE